MLRYQSPYQRALTLREYVDSLTAVSEDLNELNGCIRERETMELREIVGLDKEKTSDRRLTLVCAARDALDASIAMLILLSDDQELIATKRLRALQP